jgi:hypothetical protein
MVCDMELVPRKREVTYRLLQSRSSFNVYLVCVVYIYFMELKRVL